MPIKKQVKPPSPFLRWAGSKRQLLPYLSSYWNTSYNRYVEPFAGSACLFFHIQPSQALLGDINIDLVNAYNQVKRFPHKLSTILETMTGTKDEYLRIRAIDPSSLSKIEKAARFIYLNRYCFNGLYRTNNLGVFNVPYGGRKTGRVPDDAWLSKCSKALKNALVTPGDFESILKQVKVGDFVYMDPPYRIKKRRVFNEYDPASFNYDDIERLKKWMLHLDKKGVKFLVSYADSEEARYLSSPFTYKSIHAKRFIAGFAHQRKEQRELLISN